MSPGCRFRSIIERRYLCSITITEATVPVSSCQLHRFGVPQIRRTEWRRRAGMAPENVRYMVEDVDVAVNFYTTYPGFPLLSKTAPAFADVTRAVLCPLFRGPSRS